MRPAALVCSLLLLAALGARAQEPRRLGTEGLRLEARLGLTDQLAELPAGWAPASVVLTNYGAARRVEVEVVVRAGGEPWRCRREVALSQGQRWRGWVHVPLAGTGEVDVIAWPATSDAALAPGREPVARERVLTFSCRDDRWRRGASDQTVHVACVGDRLEPRDVAWLWTRVGRWNDPETQLGHLSPDQLPDRAEGYATAHVVALRDVDLTGLSPAQQEALLAWVERGGRALLIPGLGSRWARDPVVQRLLGSARVVPHEVDRLDALEGAYSQLGVVGSRAERERFVVHEVVGATTAEPRHPPSGASPFTLEERLASGGTYRAAWHVPHGRGCVDVLPADPALPPFDRWAGRQAYAHDLVRAVVGGAVGAGADLRVDPRVLPHLGVRRLPARGLVVALVVAFVVLVGPVNYLLLRRRGAQMLLVVTVPAISLLWTGLVFVTGYATKGLATITRAATLIEVDLDGRAAHEVTALAMTAAGEGEYEVVFGAGLLATRVARDVHEAQRLPHDVRLDDAGARLVAPLGPWTQAAFRAERTRLLPGGLTLAPVGDALELQNDTDLTLVAALAKDPLSGRLVRLETRLPPGGRARLAPAALDRRAGGRRALALALVPSDDDDARREVVGRALDLWGVDLQAAEPGVVALVEEAHEVRVDGRAPDAQVTLLRARGRTR